MKTKAMTASRTLWKSRTGIRGFDEITGGGLPAGRPTLVCGAAGCGKTFLAMEFLVRGATEYDEPGVFMAFEETGEELADNMTSLGFDLKALVARKKLLLDYVYLDHSENEETGAYDLECLFIRLGDAIDSIKAKRVVLDTIEGLFPGLPNQVLLRAELRFAALTPKAAPLSSFLFQEPAANIPGDLQQISPDGLCKRRIRLALQRPLFWTSCRSSIHLRELQQV
jgi:circadian clock protein KaiC